MNRFALTAFAPMAAALFGLGLNVAFAETTLVHSQAEYEKAYKAAGPGDTIVLANGTWEDFEIRFVGEGTAEQPITLTAEEKGKVILSGQSNLRLSGKHLVVSGLVFRDGFTPTSEVISFRTNAENLAYDSRVTEVVIDGYNNPERTETDFWVMMYGRNNRFDHNHLAGKNNNGVTMAVRLNTEDSRENQHRIDHNYFGPRPILGSNGGETLRIGTSHYSMFDSLTVVENNWFERCDGEVEIISSKSGGNVFRNNVFHESRGTLTLRHGNGNTVEGNVFLGNGVPNTGGIRVINQQQVVRDNYLEGLTGYRFGAGLTIMNGVPNSPVNRYMPVAHAVVENNTIINVDHVELAAGSDAERSAVPTDSVFRHNLLQDSDDRAVFGIHDDISGIGFSGNVATPAAAAQVGDGFEAATLDMVRAENGLLYPADEKWRGVGAPPELVVTARDDTGADWYAKPDLGDGPGRAATAVTPSEDALFDAVEAASAGDVIELAPGTYRVRKLLRIDRPLTIRGAAGAERPTIQFERTALAELVPGGRLVLESLAIDGSAAPDRAGNAVIRTQRRSMTDNYTLVLRDVRVHDLDINHSFNVLEVAKGTFADRIIFDNTSFETVTGTVLALDVERDDLGLYNAEVIEIRDSSFADIGGAVMDVYRGGRDESTFGPRVTVAGSTFRNVGKDSRNRSGAAFALHGVQRVDVQGNAFIDSRPIKVVETVGEPVTTIENNRLEDTPAPEVGPVADAT